MSIIAQDLQRIGASSPVAFAVTFANGDTYRNRAETPQFSLRFHDRAAEWGIAAFGQIGMCDAYFNGAIDIDGDLGAAFRAGMASGYDASNALVEERNRWHEFRHSNSSHERAKENARAHYGLGTAFYRLWLDDPLMMDTCAYWLAETTSLEEAQVKKIDHVCRKLLLREGESDIDIGCGFGGFMFHAAPRYGVHVTGINTTTEQVVAVRDCIKDRRTRGTDSCRRGGLSRPAGRVRQGRFDRGARARRTGST